MKFLPPEWHDCLSSTNTVLAQRLRAGEQLPAGFVLAAREQTAGKGRYDRRWVSHPGRDLTFSALLRSGAGLPRLASLPLAAALGVARALDECGVQAQTKWPNDLLVQGRKICGILAEHCQDAVVLGIGLNANMRAQEAAAIDRPATSLLMETGREHALEELLECLLGHMGFWLARWEVGGFAALRQEWLRRCVGLGEYIRVGEGKNQKTGVLLGFGEEGQLLLREDDGMQSEIWAGDLNS